MQWTESKDLASLKRKKLEFGFKMNHIKQVVSPLEPCVVTTDAD